jgi:hypothetical protein
MGGSTMKFLKIIYSFLILTFSGTALHSMIWIVDNNANPAGNFTTLADAHTAANSGDTVYVYPSSTIYAGFTCTKQLYIFGAGFNLDIYGGQASSAPCTIGGIFFNPGSEGSLLEGFAGNFIVNINTDNITIIKNDLRSIWITGSSCVILQNDIVGHIYAASCINIDSPNLGDILISNNKIYNTYNGYNAIYGDPLSDISIINNVIRAEAGAIINVSTNSLVQNNIILSGVCSTAPYYQHNMSNSNQLPETNGNIINVDMNTVFEDPDDFVTGLHLLPGSPAIGTGFNGTDMGIYGGNHPFMDGGIPDFPSIFYLESEATTSIQNGLDVLIKAKSNK